MKVALTNNYVYGSELCLYWFWWRTSKLEQFVENPQTNAADWLMWHFNVAQIPSFETNQYSNVKWKHSVNIVLSFSLSYEIKIHFKIFTQSLCLLYWTVPYFHWDHNLNGNDSFHVANEFEEFTQKTYHQSSRRRKKFEPHNWKICKWKRHWFQFLVAVAAAAWNIYITVFRLVLTLKIIAVFMGMKCGWMPEAVRPEK